MADSVILRDIQYGNHERQTIDILIPKKAVSDSGVILFIHGGGWTQGDKSDYFADAQHSCRLGYISATMNYRFASKSINFNHVLDDVTNALKTLKKMRRVRLQIKQAYSFRRFRRLPHCTSIRLYKERSFPHSARFLLLLLPAC